MACNLAIRRLTTQSLVCFVLFCEEELVLQYEELGCATSSSPTCIDQGTG